LSSGSVAEFGDELEVDLLAVGFAPIGGVVELVAEGSAVIFAGGEVGAGFADRFVSAVQDGGSRAVPVAEQSGGLRAQSAHVRTLDGDGRGWFRLGVEGLDLFGDGEVFGCDGAVGDSGVSHRHGHRGVCDMWVI